MPFFKQNIFGIIAVFVAAYLLFDTISDINEIQNFFPAENIGEYVAVEKRIETTVSEGSGLITGKLKVSLVFLMLLLIPVVLLILHKRKKGHAVIFYSALILIVINFLTFPYFLTLLNSSINTN